MDAVIRVAQQAVEPTDLERGGLVAMLDGTGGMKVTDLEKFGKVPGSAHGTVTVYTVQSFADYFFKHATENSQIFVDAKWDAPRIVGVLNTHGKDAPGWHDHVIALEFRKSPQFEAWLQHNDKLLPQTPFAEFIELNLRDIIPPPARKKGPQPNEMLALAQDLDATREVQFKSSERLADGNRQFVISEETKAKAGKHGDIKVPEQFFIGIPLYECTDKAYEITAQFRWRIGDQGLKLGYVLERLSDVVKLAVADVVAEIKKVEGSAGRIVYGKPITGLR
jgi:uncharacterized protein YfdQ (DUF2303 family)